MRQIGKRNKELNRRAVEVAKEIQKLYPDSKSARRIAADALRELTGDKIQKKLKTENLVMSVPPAQRSGCHLIADHLPIELKTVLFLQYRGAALVLPE